MVVVVGVVGVVVVQEEGKQKKGAADQITLGRYCVPGARASDHLSSKVWVITGRNKRWIPSCPWKGGAEVEGKERRMEWRRAVEACEWPKEGW